MNNMRRSQIRTFCSMYMQDYDTYDEIVKDIYGFYFLDEEPKDVGGDILHEVMVYKNDVEQNGARYYGTD